MPTNLGGSFGGFEVAEAAPSEPPAQTPAAQSQKMVRPRVFKLAAYKFWWFTGHAASAALRCGAGINSTSL